MRLFCHVVIGKAEIESMETAMKTWRRRVGGLVLTENMTGLRDGGDGNDADPEERMSELTCVENWTRLATWLWLFSAVHLTQMQLGCVRHCLVEKQN